MVLWRRSKSTVEEEVNHRGRISLTEAVSRGDVNALSTAYSEGENMEVTDTRGNNLLHLACEVRECARLGECSPRFTYSLVYRQSRLRYVVRAVLVLTFSLKLWEHKNDDGKVAAELANRE